MGLKLNDDDCKESSKDLMDMYLKKKKNIKYVDTIIPLKFD